MSSRTSRFLVGTVTLLILATLVLGWSLWQQSRREQFSSELAVTVTQSVLTSASAAELTSNAHPDLLAQTSSSELNAYLAYLNRQLGELQNLLAITGGSEGGWLPGIGEAATASYEISLQFAEHPATALLELQQLDGIWRVREFSVDAPALYQ